MVRYLSFYQILTFLILFTSFFFPTQLDARINYIIIGFSILIFPLFFKNVKEDVKSGNKATIFFILFLVACSVSTIFSIDLDRSVPRLFLYYAYFITFTSIRSIFPTLLNKEILATYYLLLITILSIISLYYTLIVKYVNRAQEGVSFMWVYYGHNHLSALLIFALPISLYFLKKYWHKKYVSVVVFTTCFLVLALYLTFSRASIISLVSASTFGIVFFRFIPKQKIPLLFIIGFFILLLTFMTIGAKQIGVTKPDILSSVRLVYWKTAIANGFSHLITGTGLDTFRHLVYNSPHRVLKTDFTHNFFLQILSDTGILGFLSSIGLIFSVFWQASKTLIVKTGKLDVKKRFFAWVLFVGLLASTLNTLVDFDWQLPAVFLSFWIFAGFFRAKNA